MRAALRIACLSLALLAGCAPAHPSATQGRLVTAMMQEPGSLNPLFMTGGATSNLVPLVFSYLLTLDEHNVLVPDVASAVPTAQNGGIAPDGLTITYRLRRNVKWQDGQPVTSRDVVFTFNAVMNPRNNTVSRSGYDQIARVDAAGPWEVRVHLRRRYAPILTTFLAPDQNYPILPAHVLASQQSLNESPFNTAPLGSGPYRVVAWQRGDRLSLERFTGYYKGTPAIPSVDVRFVTDANTILNQIRTHDVGMTLVAQPALLPEYRATPGVRVVRAPVAGGGELFFNVTAPLLRDTRVRRAVVEAVDFPRLVRKATHDAQHYAAAPQSLYSWAYDATIAPLPYDPRAAGRLLDAAGWHRAGDGLRRRSGQPLALQLAITSGDAVASTVAVILQQELAAIGISLSVHAYNATQFRAPAAAGGPLYGGRYDLGFIELYTSVDPDLSWLFGCKEVAPGGFNLARYCDPVAERAMQAGMQTYDTRARRRYESILERRVRDDVPIVPLWQQNAVDVVPDGLEHFRPAADSPVWNAGEWRL